MTTVGVGGINAAAAVLRCLEPNGETAFLDRIDETDAELGRSLRELMFSFEDLAYLDDRDLQMVLCHVSSETLLLALAGAGDQLCEKIYRNLSARTAGLLREDLEDRGKIPLREISAAQQEIAAIARRMGDAGDLPLRGQAEQHHDSARASR